MSQQTRLRATIVLGLLLSFPAFRTWSDGGIDLGALAIRLAIAMVVAFVAVSLVGGLLDAYTTREGPPVEEDATGDDVDVVADGGSDETGR